MKTLLTKISQFALMLVMAFGVAQAADAGFVTNPWPNDSNRSGIVGVGDNGSFGVEDTFSLPSDGVFYAAITYQNGGGSNIAGTEAYFQFQDNGTSSSQNIQGRLRGQGATQVSDVATITGLPSSWQMELDSVRIYNNHGNDLAFCTPSSAYIQDSFPSASLFDNSWGALTGAASVLDSYGTSSTNNQPGVCDQGHVIGKFIVTAGNNTASNLDISTDNASGVDDDSATFNGSVDAGTTNGSPWFVYGTNSNPQCDGGNLTNGGTVYVTGGSFSVGQSFDQNQNGLMDDTTYYYRACAENSTGNTVSGDVESFTTDDTNNGGGGTGNDDEPEATTNNEDDVDEDSAELNGSIDMNDFDNGIAFFVWGESESDVDGVDNENSYDDINEQGDDLQKQTVDTNLDNDDDFSLDITGLDADEDYYYRMCVQFTESDGDQEVHCGDTENFQTDDNNGNNTSNNNDDEFDIDTRGTDSIGVTTARLCGDLVDDGGDTQRTWIEYRRATSSNRDDTTKVSRGEGFYCANVSGLTADTTYYYRACADDGCGAERSFTTAERVGDAERAPIVSTGDPTSVRANSAVLNGFFVVDSTGNVSSPSTVWFNYGRTASLGSTTRTYAKNAPFGEIVHNFTNLAANTRYYYQAVAQNSLGTNVGSIKSFRTGSNGVIVSEPEVEIVEDLEDEEIDLSLLGLGLSLVRLDIDDEQEQVTRGDELEYRITWENISTLDLTDIDLKVTLPAEVEITNSTRGALDADQNAIFYTIDDLDEGEEDDMVIFATVVRGAAGDALTAEATLAFDNPVNQAQENATDYDVDTYGRVFATGTGSVFGLADISFLGWLVILLGLLIIFLVARWLYLEREELRAHAYAGGYRQQPQGRNYYGNAAPYQAPATPVYREPAAYQAPVAPAAPAYEAPVNPAPAAAPMAQQEDPGYRPYRPNRG